LGRVAEESEGREVARRTRTPGGRAPGFRVRVTPEEELELRVRAERAGVSVPRLLVESALHGGGPQSVAVRREALTELFAVERLLGAMSRNINQLAKHANATGTISEDLAASLAALRRLYDRIESVMDELALR